MDCKFLASFCMGRSEECFFSGAMMTIYAVCLNEPSKDVWDKVIEKWGNKQFILSPTTAFVASPDLTLTSDIARMVGISDESGTLGVVFEVHTYNGFNRSDLWEWLRKVEA